MRGSHPSPDVRFGLKKNEPAALRLVKGPIAAPCEERVFPFWLCVVVSTLMMGIGAVGAHYWFLPVFLSLEEDFEVPVMDLRQAESREVSPEKVLPRPRVVPVPVAPRMVQPVTVPAVQPQLVSAPPVPVPAEPYDPSEELEEAAEPFPAKPEPVKEPVVAENKQPKPSTKPRPERRPRALPKSVAKGKSRPAEVVRRYQPPYPRSARRAGVEGRVVLAVQVKSNGRVGSVRVASSSGSGALDSAAISAVKRWSFAPEQRDGKAVSCTLNVPFRFELN